MSPRTTLLPLRHLPLATLLLALQLSSAQAAPPDGGLQGLQAEVQARLAPVLGAHPAPLRIASPANAGHDEVHDLLRQPLDAAAAVRLALLNSPALQASLGTQGSSITDQQGPDFPARIQARNDAVRTGLQAYKAWVQAVAAARAVQLEREALDTARTADELQRRMVRAGNSPRLFQAQTQAAVSDAGIRLARSELAALAAREGLIRTLGLWGAQTRFQLAAALPALPAAAPDTPDLETRALAARSALQAERLTLQRKLAALAPATVDERWDALADAARLRADAIQVRSQAREAAFALRTHWDIAHHLHTAVLPLRDTIQEELTLRYNGMLTSVFEVLADSRTRTQAQLAASDALRDYWLAHADLQAVLAGLSPEGGSAATSTASPAASSSPAAAH